MKKTVRNVCVVLVTVAMTGCGIPDKHMVSQPVDKRYMSKHPSVYGTPDSSKPKTIPRSPYLQIEEPRTTVIEEDVETTLPSMIYIGDRIHEYSRKLELWKELDSQSVTMDLKKDETERMVTCFRRLQNVMNGYGMLRTKILQMQTIETAQKVSNEEIFTLQKNDISFLESSCGRLLTDSKDQSVGWSQREEKADLSQLETLIDRNAENREYEEIIQVWLRIPEFQRSRIHLRTKILYGNALMFLHQEEKAAEIYQQVVDQMSDSEHQATDLVSLRKILADLYTASGQYKSAATQYKQISEDYSMLGRLEEWSKMQLSILDKSSVGDPEITEYSSLLRNFLGFIPERDGYKVVWQAEKFLTSYPYSPVASNVDFINEAVVQGADGWFSGLISEVDAFKEEKKFEEALEFLETIPTDILSADHQIQIKEKNQEVLLAEAVDRETEKMALIQELQHQWNNGMVLAKDGKYDEAIVVFTNLLDTEYSAKAENKLDEISLEAAKADRKKAANLFVRFTKTTDLESRKKLLIESRRLLKNILVKYPEVEIGAKVRKNINRVELEMNTIDPTLVSLADQEEELQPEVDGADSIFAMPGATMEIEQQRVLESDI
jgi:tetratricopeptide (TPR) repeat protein